MKKPAIAPPKNRHIGEWVARNFPLDGKIYTALAVIHDLEHDRSRKAGERYTHHANTAHAQKAFIAAISDPENDGLVIMQKTSPEKTKVGYVGVFRIADLETSEAGDVWFKIVERVRDIK